MDKMVEFPCQEFVLQLASAAPTPGGGGAAALSGAMGMALAEMVGNLTVGKKKYAEHEEEVRRLMAKARVVREELLKMVDEDAVFVKQTDNERWRR